MPSPDLPGYIDLTLEDRGPAELVERAAANLPVSNPGHVWEPASVEAAVIESLALIASEVDYQINRLPAVIFETLATRLGVAYDQGAAPIATVDITFADNAGYALAAGSRLVLDVDGTPVIFTLDIAAVAAPGGAFVNAVPVTGAAFTAIANGVAVGTPLELLDNFVPFQLAVLDTVPAGGAGPESVSSWFDRVAARLQRLTEVLSSPAGFEAAAVDLEPAVVRVKVLDRFNPASGNTPAAKLDLGHVTVIVGAAGGAALTTPQKTALEAALEEAARVEIDVHLIDPTITQVQLTVTVERLIDYTAAEVQASIRDALNTYLDPSVWPWGTSVYLNELVSVIDQAEGVSRVKALTLGTSNRLPENASSLTVDDTAWRIPAGSGTAAKARDTVVTDGGVNSLRAWTGGAGGTNAVATPAAGISGIVAVAGKQYTARAEIMPAAGVPNRATQAYIAWSDAAGAALGSSAVTNGVEVAGVWTPIVVNAVAPAGTGRAELIVQTLANAAGEAHHFARALIGESPIVAWSRGSGPLAAADLVLLGNGPLADFLDTAATVITVDDPA